MTVSEKIMGAEAHWLMGRVMPREFLHRVGQYLHHVAPDREDDLMDAIEVRADELVEADQEMATTRPPRGRWPSAVWQRFVDGQKSD